MSSKQIWYSVLVILMTLIFVGCSDDEESPTNTTNDFPSQLVGTWAHDSVTVNGTAQSQADFFEWDQDTQRAQTTIHSNSTQKYEEFDAQNSVVWYDEGTLTITGQTIVGQVTSENGQPVTPYTSINGTWNLTGSTLLITIVDGTDTARVYLTKQ